MTYRFLPALAFLLVLVSVLVSCRKDKFSDDEIIIPPTPVVLVQTGVTGIVYDESNNPLKDATVWLGSASTTTDENGYFALTGLADAVQGSVRVEKPGYFPSLASFSVKSGDTGRVKVSLRSKTLTAQLDAATGGMVQVSADATVQLAGGSFVRADGSPYNGPVQVFASHLDPTDPKTDHLVPASWRGRAATGADQVLLSFGMLHVLLETPAGERLQINKSAQITVPAPASRLALAPATIPLWYLDEDTGIWKEEGSAVLDGNVYKGSVDHFSLWNCDDGIPVVQITGIFRVGGGVHPYAKIRVTRPNGTSASTTTTASGFFNEQVPANEVLLVEVLNECDAVVYSETIGPLTENTDMGIISVSWTTDWVQVTGALLNCNQEPVSQGYIHVWTDNQASGQFPIPINPATGEFAGALANCGGTNVSLVGYDLAEQTASDLVVMPVAPTVDFGDVEACDVPVVTGVRFEFGGMVREIPGATAQLLASPGSPPLYEITAVDAQDSGNKVIYIIHLLDWNQNPANPFWGFSMSFQLLNQPDPYYEISGNSSQTIESLVLGTNPGELVIFKITNAELIERPSGTVHQNATVTITATLL